MSTTNTGYDQRPSKEGRNPWQVLLWRDETSQKEGEAKEKHSNSFCGISWRHNKCDRGFSNLRGVGTRHIVSKALGPSAFNGRSPGLFQNAP